MKRLTTREKELVRIGAAIASNCIACIEYHIPQAHKAGLIDLQIKEAVNIAKLVKKVPADMVLDRAMELLEQQEN
ncbi:MAG: carboxymuconolactone decarboxylase family protein [Candidatus Cloacimonadaceae bacterium]